VTPDESSGSVQRIRAVALCVLDEEFVIEGLEDQSFLAGLREIAHLSPPRRVP